MRFEANTTPVRKHLFLDAIAYREVGADFLHPRHTIVCALDLVGLSITLYLLATHPQKFAVAILPICIAVLYAVSCLYHWLPVHSLRQRLDHLMIAVVIAATYVPFWATQLPENEAKGRFFILGALLLGVCIQKIFFISWHKLGGVLFLMLGAYGTFLAFSEMKLWIPRPALDYFWAGVAFYVLQMAIYGFGWLDLFPQRIGHREFQHVVLLFATTLHSVVVLEYL